MTDEIKKYEVLIFDWDGTLMDSRADIVGCLKKAITACELEMPTDLRMASMIGLGLKEAFAQLFPDETSVSIDRLCDAYRTAFTHPEAKASALFPRVRETLNVLKQNYILTVATGKSRRGLDHVLELSRLVEYFPITRTADETRSKPHPQMLHEIITDLDTTAAKCLMIGDTDYDLNMATNARMDSVAVTCGMHDELRLEQANPLGMLTGVQMLPAWLAGRR